MTDEPGTCGFCRGEPVVDAASWTSPGGGLRWAPCPRCGVLRVPEAAAALADLPPLSSAYADAGGDTTSCEFCSTPLDDTRPWRRGLDGAGAHDDCIARNR